MNSWPSIPALFYAQARRWQSRPLVYGKRGLHWRPLTWSQVALRARATAAGLGALGVAEGGRVGVWAPSSPEWTLADLGALSAGAVNVPVYEACSQEELIYVLRDSACEGLFLAGEERLEVALSLRDYLPDLRWVVTLDGRAASPNPPAPAALSVSFLLSGLPERPPRPAAEGALRVLTLEALEALGEGAVAGGDLPADEVERRVGRLTRATLATLQYTSGTTGEPKGVRLTHGNILSNCEGAIEAVPVGPSDTLLSFLPLSHSFERLAGYYMPVLFGGAQLYFAEGLGRLLRNMQEVSPTVVTGVPRVYEKVYARFRGARGAQGVAQRALLDAVLAAERRSTAAQRRGAAPSAWMSASRALTRDLLFGELRARLGGRLRLMVSGGAPLAEEVAEFFHAAGLLILEGYGLSEASPVLAVNRPGAYRFGSVGRPLFNVQLRVAPDGEVLARGPNVTSGYLNKPAETAALFDEEGWLRTGDIGRLDEDGYLYITDRKKDLFKTASGKLIAPQFIERALNSSPLIEQSFVVGDKRPYCVALLLPSSSELPLWAAREGVALREGGLAAWARQPEVLAALEAEVARVNRALARHETIKAFAVAGEGLEHLSTASHKLKRRAVYEAHRAALEALYGRSVSGT